MLDKSGHPAYDGLLKCLQAGIKQFTLRRYHRRLTMASIQVRLERNALTTPESLSIRFIARGSAGIDDLAADIALRHPNFSKADILTILNAEDEAVMVRLLNGEQVTKEGSFSWFPSFTGRLDDPDDPLPPLDECLHISTRISPPYLAAFRQSARIERLPMDKKLPLISSARDSLRPEGCAQPGRRTPAQRRKTLL